LILVDTSVWGHHLRRSNGGLVKLLDADQVLTHPFVVGELSLAIHPNAAAFMDRLSMLDSLPIGASPEVIRFISRRALAGTGIGWVDAHLLYSAVEADVGIWTTDRALQKQAQRLKVAGAQ
jgi:predicted nucleic acid-binding protein